MLKFTHLQEVTKIHLIIIVSEPGADEHSQGDDGDGDALHVVIVLESRYSYSMYLSVVMRMSCIYLLISCYSYLTCGASLSMLTTPTPSVDSLCLLSCVHSEPQIHNS